MPTTKNGFTLIEIIIAVLIITTIFLVALFLINPKRQSSEGKDAQRKNDVSTILNAVYRYHSDNSSVFPASITTSNTEICDIGKDCSGLADLSALTVKEKYLVSMPKDPSCTSQNGTCYMISKDSSGRLTVSAPNAEKTKITATK
jgi:prepilin-type N-terminal cleavage/methylation domain-containing protein